MAKFIEEVRALIGEYHEDVEKLKDDSTQEIFTMAFKNPTWQLRATNQNNMRKGCFYLIMYNYNGNKIWCPILTLDYKVKENKNILYSINFDYLPYKYKMAFVDLLLKTNSAAIEKNKDIQNVFTENSIDLSLENVYRWLQANGKKEYSLTAFDVLKIEKIYAVSTTLLHKFIFLSTAYVNNRMMLNTLEKLDNEEKKEEMKEKIEKYEEILKLYTEDIEKYYKALRNFEANLKLFEETG